MVFRAFRLFLLVMGLTMAVCFSGCRSLDGAPSPSAAALRRGTNLLEKVRLQCAPDAHLDIYRVGLELRGSQLVLTGDVSSAEFKLATIESLGAANLKPLDELVVLPSAELGDRTWGISCLSIANGRENPEHKAELGTQILMGEVVRIWKQVSHATMEWYLVQSQDGYLSWQQTGNIVRCTREQMDAWTNAPLLVVTALDAQVLREPRAESEPVSDVVLLNRLKRLEETAAWYKVALPDGRQGYIEKSAAVDYRSWKSSRLATAENIERSARLLLGRPYLWGGNSPRGLDCSGFAKVVFALNGVDLMRNAGHQALQGSDVSIGNDFSDLGKGDLLFFGKQAANGRPETVTHVAIYLGNKTFIHSDERVRISSLDPISPDQDARHSSRLLRARRILTP